jgi:hypothetical protein
MSRGVATPRAFLEKYRDRGFAVVAIEAFRDRDGATRFIEENNLTYHFVEKVSGVEGCPTSYLIDRQGGAIFYHIGFNEGDEVKREKEIEQLLAMPSPAAQPTSH